MKVIVFRTWCPACEKAVEMYWFYANKCGDSLVIKFFQCRNNKCFAIFLGDFGRC